MKKRSICLTLTGLVIVIAALIFFAVKMSATGLSTSSDLTITTLKIGKADAIILQNNGKSMLIDTGEEEDGEEIKEFLNDNEIKKIDALIITHYDKDHVGSADTIVENFDIGDVYIPDYEGKRDEYLSFLNAMNNKSIVPNRLTKNVNFNLGKAEVLIEPPLSYEVPEGFDEYDNNFSLITTVVYGENRFVFTGDAEDNRIREWLENSDIKTCDLVKMPHHGVFSFELENMLHRLSPEYALITDSRKNPADDITLEIIANAGAETFETKNGNITVVADGKKVTVSQ